MWAASLRPFARPSSVLYTYATPAVPRPKSLSQASASSRKSSTPVIVRSRSTGMARSTFSSLQAARNFQSHETRLGLGRGRM